MVFTLFWILLNIFKVIQTSCELTPGELRESNEHRTETLGHKEQSRVVWVPVENEVIGQHFTSHFIFSSSLRPPCPLEEGLTLLTTAC